MTTPEGSARALDPFLRADVGHPSAVGRRRRRTYDNLDLARCHQLLATHHVGRVAWSAADGPQLFPVSYAWIDECVIFRTSPYGILSELVRRTPVVFEVDEIDQSRRRGPRVGDVHRRVGAPDERRHAGEAAGVAGPGPATGTTTDTARPWADGNRNLIIGVTAQQITGRTFYPLDGGDPFP